MAIEDLIANYNAVMEKILEKVDQRNIDKVYIKTTMGEPVRIL